MELVARGRDVFENVDQAVAVVSMILLKYFPEGTGLEFTAMDAYTFEADHVLNCYADEETGVATLKLERRRPDDDNYIPWSKRI